uniref:Uncharacterized protein n=1 Tax=Arundo donax TaxID=35708 RepID=A0A0A8XTW6_ARUDO
MPKIDPNSFRQWMVIAWYIFLLPLRQQKCYLVLDGMTSMELSPRVFFFVCTE